MFRYKNFFLLLLLIALQINFYAFAQNTSFPYNDWVKKLNERNDTLNKNYEEIDTLFWGMDTTRVLLVLAELKKAGAKAGPYFQVRFKELTATMLYRLYSKVAKDTVSHLMWAALQQAYETNDEYLVAYVSWYYGEVMYYCGVIEPAAMYCLNAVEIFDEKKIISQSYKYQFLAEILYHTRDYEKSMYYTRRAIENETDTSAANKPVIINRWNTIALCWQKMGVYDSAFYYYDKAMQVANASNAEVWKGIISGNKGQVYFLQKKYDIAEPLLEYDYRISKVNNEEGSAANSLQWVARINLLQGKKDSALIQVKEAMRTLQQHSERSEPSYFQNLYYTTAEVYRVLGNSDSFYRYSKMYNNLYDSTEKAVANSRLEISRLRLDNQSNIFKIRALQKEMEEDALQRNFIIAAIVFSAAIALFILNQLRVKSKHQRELALQQKAAAEKEVAAATEQLNMFMQNIVEKTRLIEQMEQQLDEKTFSKEHARLVEELSQQTILTEEDWAKFKMLFEKIYPGFFLKLMEKIPDITLAEQRMTALTRLHLTSKQIASILGISPNSVHKAKQRLRQRFQLSSEASIEDFITKM
jgi:DNA-binding CsgD family transcriptional regulator